ncbi:MAG: glycosyl transferase [Marinilabiliales bacterium]|jgi:glycosyltransferase involved in cell wall biosynthesis|nr:MAG: glycosyl transferase [Marinilabiliales bacterium]
MKLIIQIPCYNEEETLALALDELPKKVKGFDEVEVLIINDGSTDNTVGVAQEWGVDHIVSFTKNKGLARGYMAGLEACLKAGADVIVNTDADNQYNAKDIEKLCQPILEGKADLVVGERPINNIEHFSFIKKKLQNLGSWVVRKVSRTDIPDAPSGFRAITKEAAYHLNVFNDYTYTLETIIQAGRKNMAITSVPISVNEDLRPSRLFKSMRAYIKRSIATILRIGIIYEPTRFFSWIGIISFILGTGLGIRWIILFFMDTTRTHVPSLILASILIILGVLVIVMSVLADLISVNRKILEENQSRLRKIENEMLQKKD